MHAVPAAADPFEETRPERRTACGTESQPDGAVVPSRLDVLHRACHAALADLDVSRSDEPQVAQGSLFSAGPHPKVTASKARRSGRNLNINA
jgi:hypothetical protein